MTYLRVRNWERFQHYKRRNPPWIRLYNELLDDYAFAHLQDASKWHAVGIWLLASRFENRIPDDAGWIGARINASEPVDLPALLSAGFIERYQDASTPLAERPQNSIPEAEAETEGETEKAAAVSRTREEAEGPTLDQQHEQAITDVIREVDAGFKGNERIGGFIPFPTHRPRDRRLVGEWLDAYPAALCRRVVRDLAARYVPLNKGDTIGSMAYFTSAIREEAAKPRPGSEALAVTDELPRADGERSGELRRVDDTPLELDARRVDKWLLEHPEEAEAIRVEALAALEEKLAGMGGAVLRKLDPENLATAEIRRIATERMRAA